MQISIIAAIGNKNELGYKNELLWNIPTDMKHFRNTTKNHSIIMGRKTFESIGQILPSRQNIIITTDPNLIISDASVVHSLKEAISKIDTEKYGNEVFIIGGAQIYTQAIDIADRLYITHVDGTFTADAFFPQIDTTLWKKVSEEKHTKNNVDTYDFNFAIYARI